MNQNLVSRVVESKYDIHIKVLSPLEGGTESAAWILETVSGKWIAKAFSPKESRKAIAEEVLLYQFLNRNGVRAPIIHQRKDGGHVGEIESNECRYPIIVMRFENLRRALPSSITEEELRHVGGETARMHKVLLRYPGKNEWPKVTTTDTALKNKNSTVSDTFINSINSKSLTHGQIEYFRAADARMEAYIHNFSMPSKLVDAPIHGDLALEHAQFFPDGDVYFFDFADRAFAPVAHELAVFLTWLYQWENISFNRWEQLKTWLLESYQEKTPLTSEDLSTIPYFEIRRILGATYYLAHLAKDIPSDHVINWVRRGFELGDYLTREHQ